MIATESHSISLGFSCSHDDAVEGSCLVPVKSYLYPQPWFHASLLYQLPLSAFSLCSSAIMLRYHASEIALTQYDVDLTKQRLALRRTAALDKVTVRKGAERSRDDSVVDHDSPPSQAWPYQRPSSELQYGPIPQPSHQARPELRPPPSIPSSPPKQDRSSSELTTSPSPSPRYRYHFSSPILVEEPSVDAASELDGASDVTPHPELRRVRGNGPLTRSPLHQTHVASPMLRPRLVLDPASLPRLRPILQYRNSDVDILRSRSSLTLPAPHQRFISASHEPSAERTDVRRSSTISRSRQNSGSRAAVSFANQPPLSDDAMEELQYNRASPLERLADEIHVLDPLPDSYPDLRIRNRRASTRPRPSMQHRIPFFESPERVLDAFHIHSDQQQTSPDVLPQRSSPARSDIMAPCPLIPPRMPGVEPASSPSRYNRPSDTATTAYTVTTNTSNHNYTFGERGYPIPILSTPPHRTAATGRTLSRRLSRTPVAPSSMRPARTERRQRPSSEENSGDAAEEAMRAEWERRRLVLQQDANGLPGTMDRSPPALGRFETIVRNGV